jgi:hypothetical protein
MIGLGIFKVLEKLNLQKERLITKRILILDRGQEFVLIKPVTIIIPTKLKP